MDGGDHLLAQLAHAESDDRRGEIDVGRGAEHLAEAALHPPAEHCGNSRRVGQAPGNVGKHRLRLLAIRGADSGFDQRALWFVEPAAHGAAKVDGVSCRGPDPALIAAIGRPQVEHVECMAGSQRKLHVHSAEALRQAAVLVLRVDHEHLRAAAQRTHRQRRQQVSLAGARMPEDPDVGVGVLALIERIQHHRRPRRTTAPENEAARLRDLDVEPRQKCRECAGVQNSPSLQPVRRAGQRRDVSVGHSERALLQPADGRSCR